MFKPGLAQKNKKVKKGGRGWFKHMIYIPLPFYKKKRFCPRKSKCMIHLFLAKKRGRSYTWPPGCFKHMICLALFLANFFGALSGPEKLFWLVVVVLVVVVVVVVVVLVVVVVVVVLVVVVLVAVVVVVLVVVVVVVVVLLLFCSCFVLVVWLLLFVVACCFCCFVVVVVVVVCCLVVVILLLFAPEHLKGKGKQ